MNFMTEIQQKIEEKPILLDTTQKNESILAEPGIELQNSSPEVLSENLAKTEMTQTRSMIETFNFLSQELKTAAISILESFRTEIKDRRRAIISLLTLLAFLGATTACSGAWQERWEAQFDPAKYSNDPMVKRGYDIYLQQEAERKETSTNTASVNQNNPTTTNEAYEVQTADKIILPGSKVKVVETGNNGLNIRTEAGINSNLVANVQDGKVFTVIELAGEKDGYSWVLVKLEAEEGEKEIIGYAATDWLQVLENEPTQ